MEKAHSPTSERERRSSVSPAISIGSNTPPPPPTSSAGTSTSDLYHKTRERSSSFSSRGTNGPSGCPGSNGNTKSTDDRPRTKSPNYPTYSSSSSSSSGLNGDHHNKVSSNGLSSPGGVSPSTKNVGVGANLNLSGGRHSSGSVSVGHGLFGSINGPSSVSISTGLNPIVSITSPPINGTGVGHSSTTTTNSTTNSLRLPYNRDRERNSSISPGLVPNTILPELLQQAQMAVAAAAAASAAGGGSSLNSSRNGGGVGGGGSSSSTSSSSSSGAGQSVGGTKVGLTSPTKQGILGRSGRGEMINGPTSSTNTTLNHNSPAAQATKIVSQNVNGTIALTSIPGNESELQLFRVLQRANLLSYFDVMIELGGDDVQQLCEAGEEEFLEIMALIGMASKPLHVRRLQKALQEWMSNPAIFQSPVLPPGVVSAGAVPTIPAATSSSSPPVAVPPVAPVPPNSTISSSTAVAVTPVPVSSSPPVSLAAANKVPGANSSHSGPPPSQLPIRPIPSYHSVPSAAAAMAAAAAAAQQAMFLSPSEMKSLQNKLQVMTNGHHPLLSGNAGGSAGNSPNSLDRLSSSSSGNNLTVRTNHISPSSPGGLGGAPTSFSNGYHHHPSRHERMLNGSHNDRHHENSRDKDSYFNEKLHSLPNGATVRIHADQIIPSHFLEQRIRTGSEPNSPAASDGPSETGSSLSPVPFLQEAEIMKLADAALQIAKSLPPYVFEPQLPPKKKFFGDFELILRLSPSDPRRIEEIRKASVIYGRPEPHMGNVGLTKSRKFPKPLSINEVCVNEAAAQLCRHIPALLTRREELFALAKQVVRDAELPYTSTNNFSISLSYNNNNNIYSNANHNSKHKSAISNSSASSSSHNQIELSSSSSSSNHNHSNGDHHHHYRQDRDHHHGRNEHRHQEREHHNNQYNSSSERSSNGDYRPLAKRLRLDASGMEIQEYNRPPSNTSEPSQDGSGIQITPIRNLLRRSPSDDHHSPLPLELVTVTSSSPQRSSESGSPPASLRRSVESEDLLNGFKLGNGSAPSIKITSIPVSGGCINISHDQSIAGTSGPLTLLPIKTEPAN